MIKEKERDREASEQNLIDTVGKLIEEVGFENLGINQVAKRAGCSKNLIYRYFESLDGLVYAYMKKNDFWSNASEIQPDASDMKCFLKGFFRRLIVDFRSNTALKRLRRWELSSNIDVVVEIRAQREKNGVLFMDLISQFAKIDKKQVQAISALVDTGITYLAIFEDNCQMYNGIDIQSDKGWEQIADGIDALIDIIII
jgi:AcrR family transcriptional regulator